MVLVAVQADLKEAVAKRSRTGTSPGIPKIIFAPNSHRARRENIQTPSQNDDSSFHGSGVATSGCILIVARPTEYGPLQKYDFEAKGDWDAIGKDFGEVADRLGC